MKTAESKSSLHALSVEYDELSEKKKLRVRILFQVITVGSITIGLALFLTIYTQNIATTIVKNWQYGCQMVDKPTLWNTMFNIWTITSPFSVGIINYLQTFNYTNQINPINASWSYNDPINGIVGLFNLDPSGLATVSFVYTGNPGSFSWTEPPYDSNLRTCINSDTYTAIPNYTISSLSQLQFIGDCNDAELFLTIGADFNSIFTFDQNCPFIKGPYSFYSTQSLFVNWEYDNCPITQQLYISIPADPTDIVTSIYSNLGTGLIGWSELASCSDSIKEVNLLTILGVIGFGLSVLIVIVLSFNKYWFK